MLQVDFNQPVLMYISREGCGGCKLFNPQWEIVKQKLSGRARFVKFVCSNEKQPFPNIRKYCPTVPSLVLAGPKSYFRVFTVDDKVNEAEYNPNYVIKGIKFNAVEKGTTYENLGRPYTAEGVLLWFDQQVNKIPHLDETIIPKI